MNELAEIILLIEIHDKTNPEHGTDCACMDKYIQRLRFLTESKAQRRVDYVISKAIDNRTYRMES